MAVRDESSADQIGDLSLSDIHAMVSSALLKLHSENLMLQAKLGDQLAKGAPASALITEFQILDLHAQIAKDLSDGLKTLAESKEIACMPTGETTRSLFRLDATRLALQSPVSDKSDQKRGHETGTLL